MLGLLAAPGCTGSDAGEQADPRATESSSATGSSPGTGASTAAVPAEVVQLFDRRSAAVLARDRAAWSATLDPAGGVEQAGQRALGDVLDQLPVTAWSYRALSLDGLSLDPADPDRLEVRVRLGYRLAGDTLDVVREQLVDLRRAPGGPWLVHGVRPAPGQGLDLWDLGPVAVVAGRESVVIGPLVRREQLTLDARALDRAVNRVDRIWGGGWRRPVIAVIPGTVGQLAQLLGSDPQGLEQLAAVTTGPAPGPAATSGAVTATPGATGPEAAPGLTGNPPLPAADRVLINSVGFDRLGEVARDVVLAHEVTHLATRPRHRVAPPTWLQEGFADYVGYRDSGLSPQTIAADLIDRIRAQGPPASLPSAQDFDPGHGPIGPAYAASWYAVDLLARRYGSPAVLDFYLAACAGPVETGFERLGTSQARFTEQWQAALSRLAEERG